MSRETTVNERQNVFGLLFKHWKTIIANPLFKNTYVTHIAKIVCRFVTVSETKTNPLLPLYANFSNKLTPMSKLITSHYKSSLRNIMLLINTRVTTPAEAQFTRNETGSGKLCQFTGNLEVTVCVLKKLLDSTRFSKWSEHEVWEACINMFSFVYLGVHIVVELTSY